MIRFDSVTKTYRGGARPALDAVSLEIGSGEFVFLVGASGSGKSSLLRLILREDRPTTGEIHVLGQRLTTISSRKVPYFRRTLGVVFQDFRLLPNKTVYANVAFSLQVIGKSRGFIQEAVPDVLRMVGLEDKARSLPTELSGGEQQRVAIARAVVNKPAVLLADEPTGNLDPTTSDGIMQVLATINASGTTVVMATHDVTIVDRMQRRVVELIDGRIVRDELEATYVTSAVPVQAARDPQPAWSPPATAVAPPAVSTPAAVPAAVRTVVPQAVPAPAPLRSADPGWPTPMPASAPLDEPVRPAAAQTGAERPGARRASIAPPVTPEPSAEPARPQAWLSRWTLTDEDEPAAAAESTGADTSSAARVSGAAREDDPAPAAARIASVQPDTAPNPAPVRRWAAAHPSAEPRGQEPRSPEPTRTERRTEQSTAGPTSTESRAEPVSIGSTQTPTRTQTQTQPRTPQRTGPAPSIPRWQQPAPESRRSAPPASPPSAPRDDSESLELDLDVDARLRSTAKHRVPLPEHLDFLAGLGLRDEAEPKDIGSVGPSS